MDTIVRKLIALFAVLSVITWTGLFLSSPVRQDAPFEISPGEGVASIVSRLKAEGFIRSEFLFKLSLRGSGQATRLQPGIYDLSEVPSFDALIGELTTGQLAADEVVLRVIEGWGLREIASALEKLGIVTEEEFFDMTGYPAVDYRQYPALQGEDFSDEYAFLWDKPSYVSLEGYLFPDTYRVFTDVDAAGVVDMMLANFGARLDEDLRAEIAASRRSMFEIMTMASLIEREVRGDLERRMVADLFWRRFDIGMALQADSSINYVTGKDLPSVTHDDTKLDSRYNTYKYPGLPLGPIGNPGVSALRAAVNPISNGYLYFLTDSEGTVHYGRTLEEHNRNKARYLN